MIPALGLGLGAIYSVGRAYDNIQFWSDYYKATGYRPKYPFRSGAFDWMGYGSDAGMNYHIFRNLKRL